MGSLDEELARELEQREAAGLLRKLTPAGAPGRIDFVSNDYLGLARHARVIEAGRAALAEHGAGARAARLLAGGSPLHERVEAAVAAWLGAEAALFFPSGYQANLGLVPGLIGRGDALFSDRSNHASLIDAARLSRARVFVHEHLDLVELERQLALARGARRRLVVSEGVFSMDGDAAPLAALDELCARHDAWLVVDEAHALGLLGPEGAGAVAALSARPARLAARVVTGGKALGVAGAFVVGSRVLISQLVNHARAFVYSTAPAPAVAGALLAAVELCRGMEAERAHTLALARELARALGLAAPAAAIVPFPVSPVGPVASPARVLELAARLAQRGFDVGAVRPPTVPADGARLRLVCHAQNRASEVDELARALTAARPPEAPARPAPAERAGQALFVVGTDTGIGKTVVSALLLRAARRLGAAAYWKPVQTGAESDKDSVRALAEAAPHECLPEAWHFPLAASPHEAAAEAGQAIDVRRIEEGLRGLLRTLRGTRLVVELAGGLLVPYRSEPELVTQADWLARARAPLVLVARAGLGTLNHTLLTLEALRARHLEPRALFLVGPAHPSNRATLAAKGGVARIFELPPLEPLTAEALDGWLEKNELGDPWTTP